MINCFSRSKNGEDYKLVLVRIKNVLMLEKELLRILPKNLGFVPAPVLPLIVVTSWQPPVLAVPKSITGKKSGNVKKGKSTEVKFGKYKGFVARYSYNVLPRH